MVTYNWFRTNNGGVGWHSNATWQCAIPAGSTYRRVRFSWGFAGWTPSIVDIQPMCELQAVMSLVTTIGNGSETPPNPATTPADVDPPTQRFLWYESRTAVVTAIDNDAGLITYRDSGPQEIVDTRAQVLATGIPAGDTLNLWASWGTGGTWDASGNMAFWLATAVLYSTPLTGR